MRKTIGLPQSSANEIMQLDLGITYLETEMKTRKTKLHWLIHKKTANEPIKIVLEEAERRNSTMHTETKRQIEEITGK